MKSAGPDQYFLGCDWGSTTFRLRLIAGGSRRVVAEQSATKGIKTFATLGPGERPVAMAAFLAERLGQWPEVSASTPLIISGMVGSSVGWSELPYANTPFPLDGSGCRVQRVEFAAAGGRRGALLVSGVRTADDIMRGEECALLGAHALHSISAARPTLALLAGTHPKHALLHAGALVSFRTHLTGELFAALSSATLLAASIEQPAAGATMDRTAFRAGVACVHAEGLSAALFQVRARQVLHGVARSENAWFLSGLLVGAELERLHRRPPDTELLLIGERFRVDLYREALDELALVDPAHPPVALDLATAIIAGQETILQQHGAP